MRGCSTDEVSINADSLHDEVTANFVSNTEATPEPTAAPKKEENETGEKKNKEPKTKKQIELGKTTPAATFYVLGYSTTASYSSMKQLNAAAKRLGTRLYNRDFSGRLGRNIINKRKVYTVYSGYDNPKGRMTITLGYKVKKSKKQTKRNSRKNCSCK